MLNSSFGPVSSLRTFQCVCPASSANSVTSNINCVWPSSNDSVIFLYLLFATWAPKFHLDVYLVDIGLVLHRDLAWGSPLTFIPPPAPIHLFSRPAIVPSAHPFLPPPTPPSHFPRTPFPQIPASAYQCDPTCGLLHFQSRQRAASGPWSQQHVTTRLPSPENCTGSSTPTNAVQTPEWACTALRCGGPFPPYSVPLPSNVLSPPQHLCHSFYLQWPLCTLPAATIPSILYNVWKITYLPGSLPWLPKPEILWSNSLWCTQHALNFLSRLSVRLFYLLNLIAQALLLYYHFIPLRTIQYLLEKMTFYSLLLLPMSLVKQNKCSFEM